MAVSAQVRADVLPVDEIIGRVLSKEEERRKQPL